MSPERSAVLLGSRDILVSAAQIRGNGASRHRWAMDFALFKNEALSTLMDTRAIYL